MSEHPPPEPAGGQEGEPPDLRLALKVVVALLDDIEPVLREREHHHELFLRLVAVRSVIRRIRTYYYLGPS